MSTLKVGTIQDHTNSNTAISIDNAGRVTMPNQPYFESEMTGNGSYVSRSGGTALPFNSTRVNNGGHFDTTNYRFTAPVAGRYLFTFGGITNQANPTGRMMFYVNGQASTDGMRHGINGSNTAGGGGTNAVATIQLSVNDYVDVRSQSGSTNFYESSHSSFTGILLG